MKIGDYIILEKIKDKVFNGQHPNLINVGSTEVQGIVEKLPIVGEQFYLFDKYHPGVVFSWTSKVLNWNNKKIETKNSIYKIKLKK